MGSKKILEKKYLNTQNIDQNNFGSKKFSIKDVLAYFGTIKFGQKNFWLENFLVQKIVGWTRTVPENSVSEKFSVKKIMVVQKNLGQPPDTFKTLPDIFQTPPRHSPDTLQTHSRNPPDPV